jgi:hypothetical protein
VRRCGGEEQGQLLHYPVSLPVCMTPCSCCRWLSQPQPPRSRYRCPCCCCCDRVATCGMQPYPWLHPVQGLQLLYSGLRNQAQLQPVRCLVQQVPCHGPCCCGQLRVHVLPTWPVCLHQCHGGAQRPQGPSRPAGCVQQAQAVQVRHQTCLRLFCVICAEIAAGCVLRAAVLGRVPAQTPAAVAVWSLIRFVTERF